MKNALQGVPTINDLNFKALCAFMAYKRFLIGAGDEFTSAFETDPANVVHQQAYSYSMDNDNEQYSASPFGQPQQGGKLHMGYTIVSYGKFYNCHHF